jgi:hypothetical protein
MPTIIDVTSSAPVNANYVTLGSNATLTNERQLQGTSNQIVVTDNGANSTVVLSTPQDIGAGSSPTFFSLRLSGLTSGRVVTTTTLGVLADDPTLLWDTTLKRLSVGTLFLTPDECLFSVSKDYTTQTYQNMTEQARSAVTSIGSGDVRTGRIAFSAWCLDAAGVVNKTITGAANNGSGLIRITCTGHTFATSDVINIYGIVGTTEANSAWTITVINANTFDLQGSTFTNAYVSGGTATNRSLMTGYRVVVIPAVGRGSLANFGDDLCGYTASNAGLGSATDAFWVTDVVPGGATAWRTIISSNSKVDYFLRHTGAISTTGNTIDLVNPFTDNDSTTLAYSIIKNEPIFNFGASNANKTVNLIHFDTTNTAVTGLGLTGVGATISTFAKFAYGGSNRFKFGLNNGYFEMFGPDTVSMQYHMYSFGTAPTNLSIGYKGRGTQAAPLRSNDGDYLFRLGASSYYAADDVTTATQQLATKASWDIYTLGNWTATSQGTAMAFSTTANGSTTRTDRVYIDNTGLTIATGSLFLPTATKLDWAAGNATLTHSTGLLTSNVPLSLGTSNALTAGTIELGHATDTTIARVSAGVASIEGVKIPTIVKQTNTSTSTSLTITSAQYGSTLLWSPGGTATATLPANGAAVGSWFDIILLTNQTVTISAATADTLITDGDLTADSVAFSTVSHKIGSAVRFVSDGTSWIAINIGSTTMTIAT